VHPPLDAPARQVAPVRQQSGRKPMRVTLVPVLATVVTLALAVAASAGTLVL
jgi:hypothetical protein